MTKPIDATLAILCGGAGKRLGGVPKGLLEIEGRPFIDRLLALRLLFQDVFLVTSEPAPYERFNARIVRDLWVGLGAPGALHTALCTAETEWIFVVAADMPFMTMSAALEAFDERTEDADVVAPSVDDRYEPFGALYRRSLAETFGARLEKEPTPSIHELLALARVKAITPTDRRAYTNVNTEEDLRATGARRPVGW